MDFRVNLPTFILPSENDSIKKSCIVPNFKIINVKPTALGTLPGLSLGYDIIKTHRERIKVETKEPNAPQFIKLLPVQLHLKQNNETNTVTNPCMAIQFAIECPV